MDANGCEWRLMDAVPTVVVREIPPLAHELRDNAVEYRIFVPIALLPRAERTEILGRLGYFVTTELHDYLTGRLVSDGDVKEDLTYYAMSAPTIMMKIDANGG
jgi:hypothetical protein